MNHIALYRKYRPKTFDEVIGEDHVTKTLQNQVMSGQIGHAYLFTGSRGVGKTSIAKIFARAVNCLNPQNGSACGECENCKRLEQENDINIIEIDAASNNKVDDIRQIREKVKFMPVGAKYKVYIIDEVHMLSDSAFNALLKTLEEPPAYVIFILATTEVHKLPQTILSRCVRFDFRLVSVDELSKHLAKIFDKEGIKYDEESLKIIAGAGEGSVRDTLSIADSIASFCQGNITKEKTLSVLGTADHDLIINFFDKIQDKDVGGVLELIDKIEKDGKNLAVFSKDLSKHARNLLVCKSCENANEILNLPDDVYQMYKQQSEKFVEKDLIRYMQVFSSAESELRYTLSVRLLLETTCLTAMLGFDVKKKLKIEHDPSKLSVNNVWGKIVLYLKEHKKVALHVACGDITNAKIEDKKLIIRSSDDFLIDVLENGRKEIENAIRWQGLDLEFVVVKFESNEQKIGKDIKKIENFFGNKVQFE